MVLLLSQDNDISTTDVCEWLFANNVPFQRINTNIPNIDKLISANTDKKEVSSFLKHYFNIESGFDYYFSALDHSNHTIFGFFLNYDSIWYRRPFENFKNIKIWINDTFSKEQKLLDSIFLNKKKELNVLYDFIISQIKGKVELGSFKGVMVNKLEVLVLAKSVGLIIPETIIVSRKYVLEEFASRFKNGVISKSIYEPLHVIDDNSSTIYTSYTVKLENSDINRLPDTFSPSLVQENLDKDFEIRVFYLDKKFYPMAIFSQKNSKTAIDFRNYDYDNPNRNIPYCLPGIIKNQLQELMARLNLNSGSIDLVKTKTGEIFFLEVNPVGQYSMVGFPCNYNLDFEIYKYLTNHE